jgi:hypothetical protein
MVVEGSLGALQPEDGYYMGIHTKVNAVGHGRGKGHVTVALHIGREVEREDMPAEEVLRVSGLGMARTRRALTVAATALSKSGFLPGVRLKV